MISWSVITFLAFAVFAAFATDVTLAENEIISSDIDFSGDLKHVSRFLLSFKQCVNNIAALIPQ